MARPVTNMHTIQPLKCDKPRIDMKRKIVIIGHAGHGKTTVAKVLTSIYDYRVVDPTEFIAEHIMVKGGHYKTFYGAISNKDTDREKWFKAVEEYNTPDKTRLVSEIFDRSDVYVGLRKYEELEMVKEKFNPIVVWVNNSSVKPESEKSCTVTIEQADFVLNNPGNLDDLYREVVSLYTQMMYVKPDWKI